MQARAILKNIVELAGGEAVATVQLSGLGNFETFHDGYAVSHAIPRSLLAPGADVIVDIPDIHHPSDGHLVSVAAVSTGGGGSSLHQFGNVLVLTDGAGNGTVTVVFPNTFGGFTATPVISLSAAVTSLGSGALAAAGVTTTGFTVSVSGAAGRGGSLAVAWEASG